MERSARDEPSRGVTLSGSGAAAGDEADVERRATDVLGFSAARRSRDGKNSGERYAGVPSLSAFLNPPTLRPSPSQAPSRRPPPARHQTAALATFLLIYLISFLHAENDSDLHTSRFLPPQISGSGKDMIT